MNRFISLMLVWGLAGLCTLSAAVNPGSEGSAPARPDTSEQTQQAGQQGTEGAQGGEASMWSMLLPLIILVAFMYFVMIRPQKKEQQKRQEMLGQIKVGEKVVTIGGMHGTVRRRGENDVDLEVADGVVMTFNVGAIHERLAEQQQQAKKG